MSLAISYNLHTLGNWILSHTKYTFSEIGLPDSCHRPVSPVKLPLACKAGQPAEV